MKRIILKMISMLFTILFMVSCQEDFLDRPSQSQISTEQFYQTKDQIRIATATLYGGEIWSLWTSSPYLLLGDMMSGNFTRSYYPAAEQLNTFTLSGSNVILENAWKSLYAIVGHCNVTIKAIEKYTPTTVAIEDKNAGLAEAKFIRAMAYYHLVMLWGEVPIIEDNDLLVNTPLVNKHLKEDVYKLIETDLIFAADNLPLSDVPGRVTTWSAKGMLSKVYLTMAGLGQSGGTRNQAYLDLAKANAEDVIKNSGLELFPSYYDLFKTQNNDNPESLFALQWSIDNTGWLTGNMLLLYSPSNDINPQNNGAWNAISATYDLYKQYAVEDSIRRKATFMLPGDHYAELNSTRGGYNAGGTSMKKHIIGNGADNDAPAMVYTASIEHNALLRLADVYLIYAEAILGNSASTSDADALLYFNKVRKRAIVDATDVTTLTSDIIFKERRIELAAEGHYWFDLVRLSYYAPQKAINLVNDQERTTFTYNQSTEVATPGESRVITPASINTFTLQLPATEITANPKLAEPAVPYY